MADARVERYVPSASLEPYREVMNSPGVQAELLRRAREVASAAGASGVGCEADVMPGRTRAHARATAERRAATDFASHGRNARADRVLIASIDAARG